jgi:FixJ family two-component response regulator
MIFDARTGFLFLGLLSLVVALALWAVLFRQRRPSLHLWCGGGLAAAGSSFLLALRDSVPDLFSHTLAALLAFVMLVLKLQAVRLELDAPESGHRLVVLVLAYLALYAILRLEFSAAATFAVLLGVVLVMNARIAWWAWRLGLQEGRRSARWISVAFGAMAVMYGIRLINVGLGTFDTHLLTQGYDALIFALTSVLGIILSNLGWLWLSISRAIAVKSDLDTRPVLGAGDLGGGIAFSRRRHPPSAGSVVEAIRVAPIRRAVTVDDQRLAERHARGCIVVIDEDDEVAERLRALFTDAGYACDIYGSTRAYLEELAEKRPRFPGPSCVVCDLRAIALDDLELEPRLLGPNAAPLLLAGGIDDMQPALSALRAGALDVLVKPLDSASIQAAVSQALAVNAERRRQCLQQEELGMRFQSLTGREREIAHRVALGQRNQEVAEALEISLRTVKRHRQQVMRKMQVATLADLVRVMDSLRPEAARVNGLVADRRMTGVDPSAGPGSVTEARRRSTPAFSRANNPASATADTPNSVWESARPCLD